MSCTSVSTLQAQAAVPLPPGQIPTTNQGWQSVRIALQAILSQIQAAAGVTGVNVIPQQYALAATDVLPPMTVTGGTAEIDTTTPLFGAGTLKLTVGSGGSMTVVLGSGWPLHPGWQWIPSFWAQASASASGVFEVITPAKTYSTDFTPSESGFDRLFDILNLGADTSTSFGVTFKITAASGVSVWLSGLQMEPYFGTMIQPSPFISTSPPLTQDYLPDGTTYVRLSGSHAAGNVAYNFKGVWSSTTAYVQGDEVVYQASYWLATAGSTDEAPATGSSYWQVVGSYSGFQGAWSSTVSYVQGAEVTSGGNYWVCVTANSNSEPSTSNSNWQIAGPLNLDSVADGTTYTRTLASVQTDNVPDLSKGILNKVGANITRIAGASGTLDYSFLKSANTDPDTLDSVPDGSTYVRIPASNIGPSTPSAKVTGFQTVSNPDFQKGLTDYKVYGTNTLSLVNNTSAPAGFAQVMGISESGGFYYGLSLDSGQVEPDTYHIGDTYIIDLLANVPTGYTLNFTNNSLGTGGSYTWLSSQAGTGNWQHYIVKVVIGTSPSTAAAFPFFYLTGTAGVTWYVAQLCITDIDQPTRFGVLSVDDNQRALIDFSQTGHVDKILDNINDGTTYARTLATALTSNQVDLSKAGVINKVGANITRISGATGTLDYSFLKSSNTDPDTLDSVPDGTTYARTLATALTSNQVDLSQTGVINKTLANIADATGRYAVGNAGGMSGVTPKTLNSQNQVDLTSTSVVGVSLATIKDATTAAWAASTVVDLGYMILDSNGNVQIVIVPGTTGTSTPTWSTTLGGTTDDGSTVVWEMIGPGNRGAVAQTELSTTNTIKRINDGTYIRDVLPIAQAIGTTADANGNYLANGSTSALVDDAGLGNTAVWGDVSQPPTTLAGYGITNAQETLGNASGTEILFQASGGGPYWAPQYGSNMNLAATPSQSAVTLPSTTGSYVQIGNTLYIPNPNQEISLLLFFKGHIEFSGITSATEIDGRFNVSTDGGGTYVTYGGNYGYAGVSGTWIFPYSDMAILANITPTGDIYIEYQMERTSGTSGTLYCGSQAIGAIILPQSLYSVVGPTLAVTVPSTETASCTSSGSSCSAPTSITASPTGGKPAYSYSWSVTSGAGTITSGATAQTVYVSETGTTASPANTLNTTYECQVTDSASSTANASCTVTSSFLLGYNSITVSLSATNGGCSAGSGDCTATGYDAATASGGNGSYTYSWSITSQTGSGASITAGATSSECTIEGTAAVPSKNTVSMQCVVNDSRDTGAVTVTNTVTLNYRQTV